VIESTVQAWSEHQRIEHFADPADVFSGPATLSLAAEDTECTGQAVPGTPILRELLERGLESPGCLLGLVIIFQLPAATKPPVTGIARCHGPVVKQDTSAPRLASICQGGHENLARCYVIGVFSQQRLK
jgi:hypothetical protein